MLFSVYDRVDTTLSLSYSHAYSRKRKKQKRKKNSLPSTRQTRGRVLYQTPCMLQVAKHRPYNEQRCDRGGGDNLGCSSSTLNGKQGPQCYSNDKKQQLLRKKIYKHKEKKRQRYIRDNEKVYTRMSRNKFLQIKRANSDFFFKGNIFMQLGWRQQHQ